MPAHPDDDLTIGAATVRTSAPAPVSGAGRYAPGSIVASRYRLVALLGRGGMGEVYRAEDLTLEQPVALKFLPDSVAADAARLAQFHGELRLARQVSHRNVCRLYDLGDADGRRFLTMEYVDGEDLAALLRRIGRFPPDKAVDVARQLCAGVAAAHERGVIHRDLKPANVMLDGDGNVRITDFGLAVAAGDSTASHAGTPHYMAPEQLTGGAASTKSDIYALGLVLFEIFTGRRVYDAKTLQELQQQHETGTTLTPSSIVRDLDPAIERAIVRALERDPNRRPASVLAIAAALPGGDPLAEALAAGETPSPALLVAAAEADALPVWQGIAIVAGIIAGLAVCVNLAMRASFVRLAPPGKPPQVLMDRAEQILASVGYTEPRVDAVQSFGANGAYINWIAATDLTPGRWSRLASGPPEAYVWWYRTSPAPMMSGAEPFTVTLIDPPARETDSHRVVLDSQGRLIELRSTPLQYDTSPPPPGAPPWSTLFDAAGLTMSAFTPVAPNWAPADFADARAAWEGPLGGPHDVKVRVEGAAYHNRPVYFIVIGPWNQPTRQGPPQIPRLQRWMNIVYRAGIITLVLSAVALARRNTKAGRSDMRGATRFAVFFGCVQLAGTIINGHHVTDVPIEYLSLVLALMQATWQSIVLWTVYLALEPYGRKFWPNMLLGWSRLLDGRIRDARIGREVLAGIVCGLGFAVVQAARMLAPALFGYPAPRPFMGITAYTLLGQRSFIGLMLQMVFRDLGLALLVTLVFVVSRLVARRPAPAVALGMLVMFYAWSSLGAPSSLWLEIVLELAAVTVLAIVTIRFGLLASAVALFVGSVYGQIPLTFDIAHWSATASNWALALVIALTLFGFYASRAGQPLFGRSQTSPA